jgi:hypothetical protein
VQRNVPINYRSPTVYVTRRRIKIGIIINTIIIVVVGERSPSYSIVCSQEYSLITAFDDQDVCLQVVYVQQPSHSFGQNRMSWHKAMAWN